MNLLYRLFKVHAHKELQQLKLDNEQLQLQLNNQREQQKHLSYLDKLVEEKNEVIADIVKYNKELEDKLNDYKVTCEQYNQRFYAVVEDKDTLVEYLLSIKQELDNLELDKLREKSY